MKNVFEYNKPQRKTSSQSIFRPKLNRRKSRHRLIIFSSLMLLVVMLIVSCKNKTQITADPDIYYTCSMDPQVIESKPGKCPICHMDLTPVKKSNQQADNDELALSPEQMQLGNIQVDTIGNAFVGNQVVLTGTLNFDQTKINDVSARVGGRIEKLYFKKIGDYVSDTK